MRRFFSAHPSALRVGAAAASQLSAASTSTSAAPSTAPFPISSLLIANRGEVSCRISRTARRLGIRTVGVHSSADARAQHAHEADSSFCIGPPPTGDSYLRPERLVEAALRSGAQAVHPGYGFLSESAEFAEALTAAGLIFVGPPAAAIRAMGSKANAKEVMRAAGVPVTPGYWGDDASPERFAAEAARIGYPVMLKAVRGGGGKGMRIVRSAGELAGALDACRREAATSFGSSAVLVEKYLARPRHIEFQVFADAHGNVVHLCERDCSVQRRHQKVLEEAPAPLLAPALRAEMGAAAVAAAAAVGYVGAGTVEFMLDTEGGASSHFYFMEMNCRLQVEHPVTEAVLGGLDLVELQLRVAAGLPLGLTQAAVGARLRGHAVEARVYAENPSRGFLPATGLLRHLVPPAGAGEGGSGGAHGERAAGGGGALRAEPTLRVDGAVRTGDAVSVFYDPMVSKLVAWGEDRGAALRSLSRGLGEFQVVGLPNNLAFLQRVVAHPAFVAGGVDTSFLGEHLPDCLPPRAPVPTPPPVAALAALGAALRALGYAAPGGGGGGGGRGAGPWLPGACASLHPMQPAAGALRLDFAGEEGEGEGAGGGDAAERLPPLRAAVTPLGAAPLGRAASLVPAFHIALSRGADTHCFVAAGALEAAEGGGGGAHGAEARSLWAHVAAVGAGPPAPAAVGALGEPGAALLRASVVFSPLAQREDGGLEVAVFPRDPEAAARGGLLGGAPPAAPPPLSLAAAPPAPGAYRLRLPAPAFGGGAQRGAAGAGGSFPVAAPMPGKVVKVLVQQGAWAVPPLFFSSATKAHTKPAFPPLSHPSPPQHTHTHTHT
jgi:3-methylcrotonyl-CoA carboxylase alpha subunit